MSTLTIFEDERILGNILFHCDENSLKSARLVSQDWSQTALKVIAKIAFLAIENAYNTLSKATNRSISDTFSHYVELSLKRFEQLIDHKLTFRLITNILKIEFAISRQRLRQTTDELYSKHLTPSIPTLPHNPHSVFFQSSHFRDYLPKYSFTPPKESEWEGVDNLYQAGTKLCESLDSKEHSIELHALIQLLHWIETSPSSSQLETMKDGFITLISNLPWNKMPSISDLINQFQDQKLLPYWTAQLIRCHLNLEWLIKSSKDPNYELLASDHMKSDFYLPALYSAMAITNDRARKQTMNDIIYVIHSSNSPYWMQAKCLEFAPIDVSYTLASNFFATLLRGELFEEVIFYLNAIHPSIKSFVIKSVFLPFIEEKGHSTEYIDRLLNDLCGSEKALDHPQPSQGEKAKKLTALPKLNKVLLLEYRLGETVTQFLEAQSLLNEKERSSAFISFFNDLIKQKPAHIVAFLDSTFNWKEGIESIVNLKERDNLLLEITLKLIKNSIMAARLSDYFAELKIIDFYLQQGQPEKIQALLRDLLTHHFLFLDSFIARLKSFPNWETKLIVIDDQHIREEFFERILDSQEVLESDVPKQLQEKIDQKRIPYLLKTLSQNEPKQLVRETEELFSVDHKKELYTKAFQEYRSQKNLLEKLFAEMKANNLDLTEYF
ncbi:MAG: hypothetical protein ACSNEK_07990 [Parachlamydiaceae bacterium]